VPATLPPLNALKAFEAAARLNGFALAAQELGVSPAAVSQLVRKLERHLGKTLFTRLNNRIILTDAGKAIFAGVTPAFADIVETVERVGRMSSRRKLVISSVASVAECWLLPALPRFLASHPRLRFDIRVEDEALAFPAEADLRISYGRLPSAEVLQVELCRDEVLPMCAPSFRRGRQRFTSALSKHLIHTLWGPSYGTNPTWRDWFSAYAPSQSIDGSAGHQVNASRLALQLAQAGAGIVLGQRWLAGPLLQRGDLVILSEKALPLGQSYHVSLPPSRARQPDVIALRDWLLTVAGGQVLPPHR
jgi:LysR family transcriptional regulator, glycine cleavage system transcriptional activator